MYEHLRPYALTYSFQSSSARSAMGLSSLETQLCQEPVKLPKIIELNGKSAPISLAAGLDVHLGAKMLTELTFKVIEMRTASRSCR